MNKFSSAAVSIPDMDGKEIDGGKGECVGMAINKGSIGRSVTAIPTRRNSFFRRISVIQGTKTYDNLWNLVPYSLYISISPNLNMKISITSLFQILGSFRSASMIDSVDMSLGSLRHSSMQGMPSLVAMTPDIEQKLVRTRTSDLSPDSTGITNKVRIWNHIILSQPKCP